MSRDVRKVPASWQHPRNAGGHFIPLRDGFKARLADWDHGAAKWADGLRDDRHGGWKIIDPEDRHLSYAEWDAPRPRQKDYMPDWPAESRTHFMMYECTSLGTPISPAFDTVEALARWLADTGAYAFAELTASYEDWLDIIRGDAGVTAVFVPQQGEGASGAPASRRALH